MEAAAVSKRFKALIIIGILFGWASCTAVMVFNWRPLLPAILVAPASKFERQLNLEFTQGMPDADVENKLRRYGFERMDKRYFERTIGEFPACDITWSVRWVSKNNAMISISGNIGYTCI